MLYTELLQLWDAAVQAVDRRDWQSAMSNLNCITEHTSRTLFVSASVYLALGQLDPAIKALDQTIAKDERLAVGFFQRSAAHILANRLEVALSDCIWAQKYMRENAVIDYRQLGLRYKLYSWQVLYNAAAVHCRMGMWDKAKSILVTASQERGARGGIVEVALDLLTRKELLDPLMVPEGEVFRPRKQDIEQLQQRDFLGTPKVIASMIPNDDYGGFEPLRMQTPGYYEPEEKGQDSRYMRLRSPYMAQGPGELTVPGGGTVFVFNSGGANGLATVFYDGQKGLLPFSLLELVDVNKSKGNKKRQPVPRGIPLPPGLKPPTRPQVQPNPAVLPSDCQIPPPTYSSPVPSQPPPEYTGIADSTTELDPGSASCGSDDSVMVKVHYNYTIMLNVSVGTTYSELQEQISQKLKQPASHLCLRQKLQDTQVLIPLKEEGLQTFLKGGKTGRATLWCQNENLLSNRAFLYQVVALYDYSAQGPEDLEFSEGDTIDILSEVNEEWLEGHAFGNIGIFPRCFVYQDTEEGNDG